jgi:glycosyltransferase involved in cell wall biosynthesis
VAALIPCRDEAAAVGWVVAGARRHLDRVVVVDDGSADATAARAREAGAEVIVLPRRSGKGAALRRGWEHLASSACTHALCLDGDGQHLPDDIPAFLDARPAPLLVGDRFVGGAAGMPGIRRRTNLWMSRRISRLAGFHVPDSQCGFRLVELAHVLALPIRARRFEVESDMIVAFARAGLPVGAVPVSARYADERSKIAPIRDTWRWFSWYLRARYLA